MRTHLWTIAASMVLSGLFIGALTANPDNPKAFPNCRECIQEEVLASETSPLCGISGSCVFFEPPRDFVAQAEVSGCFCEYQGRVLFLLRNPDKPQGNTWCVPGGKLEVGETPRQAIVREVREETGIELDAEILVYCQQVHVRLPGKDLNLHIFRALLAEVSEPLNIALDEHTSYCWVTLEEALAMPLIPGGSDCLRIAFSKWD